MTTGPPKFTLTDDDARLLLALDSDIEHARFELERAKRVGIDVSELEHQLDDAIALRDNLLKTYSGKE